MTNWNNVLCNTCGKNKTLTYKEEYAECMSCKEKREVAEISTEAVMYGWTSSEKYIICPHCGSHYGEDEMNESCDVECDECEKIFHMEVNYTVDYSTSKLKGD